MKGLFLFLILFRCSYSFCQIDTSGILYKGHIDLVITQKSYTKVKKQILSIVNANREIDYTGLSISGDFDSIPYFVFYLDNIQEIDIISTKPILISEMFNQFKKLSAIHCFSIVTSISNKLQLDSLEYLSLWYYKSSYFPTILCKSTKLEYLELKNGDIAILPEEILNLIHLKSLILTSNKLDSLPSKLDSLKNLEILGVGDNMIVSLPERICLMSNLREIWIAGNKELFISEERRKCIEQLPKFEKIY